jgi:hypothetical protein
MLDVTTAREIFSVLTTAGRHDLARVVKAETLPVWLPRAADDAVGEAYRKMVALKLAMDQSEELPDQLASFYKQVGKAVDMLARARRETNQTREMAKRIR